MIYRNNYLVVMKLYHFVNKDYVDKNFSKAISINIKSEAELNKAVSENQGRMLILILQNSITINGITIRAWSQIFIPNATVGDMSGIILYPYADSFWILGHTAQNGWHINKIL